MHEIKFTANSDVLNLGVKIVTALVMNIKNEDLNPAFEKYKKTELEVLKEKFANKKYKDDPVLEGFRELHTKVGRSNRDYVSSPESLRWLFIERDRFPHINTLVDIYNLISLKTGLALGAHDINGIKGNITLKITNGLESFIPLGKKEKNEIFPGEYCYIDDDNNVICRMEVLQVEPTKVTTETKNIFLIVQGNQNTEQSYVNETAQILCNTIVKYCGGSYKLII